MAIEGSGPPCPVKENEDICCSCASPLANLAHQVMGHMQMQARPWDLASVNTKTIIRGVTETVEATSRKPEHRSYRCLEMESLATAAFLDSPVGGRLTGPRRLARGAPMRQRPRSH
jgi:hypothetical protein